MQSSRSTEGCPASEPATATRWLSQSLETLMLALQRAPPRQVDFDVLLVGSGYGGAAAAAALSACRDDEGQVLRVAVLERGREFLPGAFPERMADLPGQVRLARAGSASVSGYQESLFDLRLGPDMVVALANGLGGGSLINAGVMLRARPEVFAQAAWPQALRSDPTQMDAWYAQAEAVLGSVDAAGIENRIERLGGVAERRARWLAGLADVKTGDKTGDKTAARSVPITVALDADARSAAGLPLSRCLGCGDCASGCNHGAKQSLDTNLLLQARRQGAELVTGASVIRVEPLRLADGQPGWRVWLQYTDQRLRERAPAPFSLSARRVVLAAGSLGSTEILMRSRAAGLALSDRLGEQFSGNGDVLAVVAGLPEPLDALADEDSSAAGRGIGPTITAMLDARDQAEAASGAFVVQDLAVPGAMRWMLEEGFALADTLDSLARPDLSEHQAGPCFDDPYAVTPERSARLLPVALIGLDRAQGRLRLPARSAGAEDVGVLTVDWPAARDDPQVQARHDWLARRLQTQGARLLANPVWRLLPQEMDFLAGGARGPMLSVHPLGGCAMGDRAEQGVVNSWGEVFAGTQGEAVHPGLVVLDGAIVPAALGINPALSITALTLRALAHLRRHWALRVAPDASIDPGPRRPYRQLQPELAPARQATEVELRERLGGLVSLPGAPGGDLKYLELSLVYQPQGLRSLLRPGPERRLRLDPARSRLRLFDTRPDPEQPAQPMLVAADAPRHGAAAGRLWMHAERADADARLVLPLAEGELLLFQREASSTRQRRCRALKAWLMNRGWRDSVQALLDGIEQREAPRPGEAPARQRIRARVRHALALASHAGQHRLMSYRLQTAAAAALPGWAAGLGGLTLQADKRISYTRRGNPWKQLSRATLQPAGPLRAARGQGAITLELDLFDLARQRQPLLRVTAAEDLPSSLRDIGSLLAYLTRLLIGTHLWSFRKPDAAAPRAISRLPGDVPGLPAPQIREIAVGRRGEAGQSRRPVDAPLIADPDGPVLLRLTRYPGKSASARPILMLHGYSASGTTFAHHAVQPGPAKLLWEAGYDVWIADMRSSAGMASACLPWTFEECALNDIPVAVDEVLRATGQHQLDVLAHCMGAVMLQMALLQPRQQPEEHFYRLRQRLMNEGLIRRLVISQVTPKLIFSPTNTLRAQLMQYLRPYLPLQDYAFRPEPGGGLLNELIDRLLASLPYPDEEFDIENPPPPSLRKTPWTATRHRMDLLYGRDFAIKNVAPAVFDFIDDHFGPLNLDTVAQAINFARINEITDWRGASLYLDDMAKSLAQLQQMEVLSVHGAENGLCQSESGALCEELYEQVAPGRFRHVVIAGHGHQDCLIGRDIERTVFPAILHFLARGHQR
ncbi:GMC family oxidoreductase N-terminal domain-containing protein [Paucibacter sp. APW11]|uniref:Cholesterol oxidase n=1 Tax=Roseateles aquae TaxID=3077235 RepID=A0ABU3PBU2_9BURK|nr:GMC family oxidoreductase N-terminal domain-containing protein [Paucibacter sp. APW11]MDT9000010.1 GMC family oxidoreductase N-terminal domain-containing protein [Paucibacter sp. APW11]